MSAATQLRGVLALVLLLSACDGDEPCNPDAPGTICTIAGDGVQSVSPDGTPAIDAHLNVPIDMTVAPDGQLWILDFNNYYVKTLGEDGILRTVIGSGELGNSPDPGAGPVPVLEAKFNHTTDIVFHEGYVYLAAWHNSFVKRVNLETMELENFAGVGRRTRYDGDDGPAIEAALDLPSSIAIDSSGQVVIMDQANQVIRMVDNEGIMRRLVGECVVDRAAECAPGVEPVPCPDSNKVTCGDPNLTCCDRPDPVMGCAGMPSNTPCTPRFGGDDGPCLDARLSQPFGQMADPAGRIAFDGLDLIFADTDSHRIRRVHDGVVTTIAGTGVAGFSGEGTPAIEAQINHPIDVEVDEAGNVFFTDTYNSCVRKIDPEGIITTVVGQCSPVRTDWGFAGDGGPPTEALLNWPYGIELDGGRMYVADSYNQRIRVVNF